MRDQITSLFIVGSDLTIFGSRWVELAAIGQHSRR